jgi:hypothetical protein
VNSPHENLENLYSEVVKLIHENRRGEAIAPLEKMLTQTPEDAHALCLYGECLGVSGRHEEAAVALEKSVAIEPFNGEAWGKLGGAYGFLGEWDRSRFCYDRALHFCPDMPAAHWNSSLNRLLNGDFKRGWEEYQWGVVHNVRRRRTLQPEGWAHLPHPPKVLYLWAEQGHGDTIHFLQLLALVREKFPDTRLVLEVPRELVTLLLGQPFLDGVTVVGMTDWNGFPVECDAHCGLMSLPYYLGLELSDLPVATNYLTASNPKPYDTSRLRVGVCWKGNPHHGNAANRDVPVEAIEPLKDVPGVQWVCLQKDNLMHPLFHAEHPTLNSWADTANVIASLDLVITCDTGVAHLAGAMGKECWILLPYVHDFRWLRERTDSPWYPSVSLFRQKVRGEWFDVVEAVKTSLLAKARYGATNAEGWTCRAQSPVMVVGETFRIHCPSLAGIGSEKPL